MDQPVKYLRFSLANALRATAWLCVSAGSFLFMLRHSLHELFQQSQWLVMSLDLSLPFLMVWSPMVAVGALFGQTKRSMVVGLALIILYLFVGLAFFAPRVQ
jgi:hypothetical protein